MKNGPRADFTHGSHAPRLTEERGRGNVPERGDHKRDHELNSPRNSLENTIFSSRGSAADCCAATASANRSP